MTPSHQQQLTSPPKPSVSNDDDEWSFSSALPPETPGKPRDHRATINNSNIRIDFLANRSSGASNSIDIVFAFTNNTAQPIHELHFQLAVTKVSLPLPYPPSPLA